MEQCQEHCTRDQHRLLARLRQVLDGSDVAIRETIGRVVAVMGARLAIEIGCGADRVVARIDGGGARPDFVSDHRVEQWIGMDFSGARQRVERPLIDVALLVGF